ncbi:MAG TPA: HAMP domain-containing sensor histidine kinase [Rhizomicrobium sp.]|jgi:signal transduction histidine kinase|nr:HAMP domain-containing sensor histidine kinase [Rhizomicrobium sp.]
MQRQRKIALRDSLLSRYSESLGEMAMRKRNEQALKAARAESELASRTKSAFLATMSHELKTPLNSIIGFSDVIVAQKDPKTAEYAAHIAKSGRRLLDVVQDVLDISKIESGGFVLNRQPTDLFEVIELSAEVMRDAIAEKQQTLDLRVPQGIPMLDVDARRIKQVLVNLISNASKFTPARGRVVVMARSNPDRGVTVAIADTGCGMTPEQIATALNPFGQVQNHLSRTEEGAGLGLPIARGLARQHGGDVFIESKPGQGTTVLLTLPGGKAP